MSRSEPCTSQNVRTIGSVPARSQRSHLGAMRSRTRIRPEGATPALAEPGEPDRESRRDGRGQHRGGDRGGAAPRRTRARTRGTTVRARRSQGRRSGRCVRRGGRGSGRRGPADREGDDAESDRGSRPSASRHGEDARTGGSRAASRRRVVGLVGLVAADAAVGSSMTGAALAATAHDSTLANGVVPVEGPKSCSVGGRSWARGRPRPDGGVRHGLVGRSVVAPRRRHASFGKALSRVCARMAGARQHRSGPGQVLVTETPEGHLTQLVRSGAHEWTADARERWR